MHDGRRFEEVVLEAAAVALLEGADDRLAGEGIDVGRELIVAQLEGKTVRKVIAEMEGYYMDTPPGPGCVLRPRSSSEARER